MRAGSQPTATAASSTVALDTENSRMRPSRPNFARWSLAACIDIVPSLLFVCFYEIVK